MPKLYSGILKLSATEDAITLSGTVPSFFSKHDCCFISGCEMDANENDDVND